MIIGRRSKPSSKSVSRNSRAASSRTPIIMLKTKLCELFGIEYPIISAGMGGGVARAELASAVSEAGGLGTIGLVAFGVEGIHTETAAARARTRKPLAANLIVPFL